MPAGITLVSSLQRYVHASLAAVKLSVSKGKKLEIQRILVNMDKGSLPVDIRTTLQ